MKVDKLSNVVCFVITGEFDPMKVTAQSFIEYNIITKDESCQIETQRLNSSFSFFTIAKEIDVLCSKDTIQVSGKGEVTDRVLEITRNLLISGGFYKVDSMGVNAYVDFTFKCVEDCYQFGNFFVPLDFWQTYLREGRVFEFTLGENSTRDYPDYRKSINIRSIRSRQLPDGQKVVAVRMSVNYDFRLDSVDKCIEVVGMSLDLFDKFWQESESIFENVK